MSQMVLDYAALAAQDAEAALSAVAEAVQGVLDASRGAFYLLELATGSFSMISANSADFLEEFPVSELTDAMELMEETVGSLKAFEVFRGRQVVGVCIVSHDFRRELELKEVLKIVPFLFNRANTERLVSNLNKPIPYNKSQEEFFRNLSELARDSSGMQYGAYRSISGEQLVCFFGWGFERYISSPEELSIGSHILPPLIEAIEKREVQAVLDLHDSYPMVAALQPFQKDVRSFCAVPVIVGGKVHGVISFGASCRYRFSETEKNSLLCVANGLGVAINNFKLNWQGQTAGAEFERVSSSIVGVEVAQAIRHHIYNAAGSVSTDISTMETEAGKFNLSQPQRERFSRTLQRAKAQALRVQALVQEMKDVMSVDRTIKVTTIKSLWTECVSHLGHKIEALDVNLGEVKKTPEMPLIADMVKHIFHNLIMNSLDAFEGQSRFGRREVNLRVDRHDRENRMIHLIYYDNGPGLNLTALEEEKRRLVTEVLVREVNSDTSLGELIFRQQVTTKDNGSGYGLWLCRKMAMYHCGGIEFQTPPDGRGVAFRISLSYDLEKLMEENDNKLFYYDDNIKKPLDVYRINSFLAKARR